MKVVWSFCDRCGRFCPLPLSLRVSTCHHCTVGEPSAVRLLTSQEIRLAYEMRRLQAVSAW